MYGPVQVSVVGAPLVDAVNKFMQLYPAVWTCEQGLSLPRLHIYCRHDSSHREANAQAPELGVPVVQVYNYAEGAFLTSWSNDLYVDWSPPSDETQELMLMNIVLQHHQALKRQWV